MRFPRWTPLFAVLAVAGFGCPNNGTNNDSGTQDSGNPGQDSGCSSCGTDAGTDAGPSDAGGSNDSGTADAGSGMTVTGVGVIHWVTSQGIIDEPINFSGLIGTRFNNSLGAWVADPAADGGWDFFPGTGTDAGTFSIPNVVLPPGQFAFYVQTGATFAQTESSSVDWSQYAPGRPRGIRPDAGTVLDLFVDAGAPLPSTSQIWWASEDTNLAANLVALVADAGGFSGPGYGASFDLSKTPQFDTAKEIQPGDVLALYELYPQISDAGFDGGTISSLYSSFAYSTNTFGITDGTPNALTADLVAGTNNHSDQVHFSGTGFWAQQPNGATPAFQFYRITAELDVDAGPYFTSPLLALSSQRAADGDFDVHLIWDNPFPAPYVAYGELGQSAIANLPIPGTAPDGGALVDQETLDTLDFDSTSAFAFAFNPVQPYAGSVEPVTLDGNNIALGPFTLGSLTPLLQWIPNQTSLVVITITHLHATTPPSNALARTTFTIYTADNHFQVPPGMLLPGGQRYVIRVRAINDPNGAYQAASFYSTPFVRNFPLGWADSVSAVLTTP